MFGEVSTVQAGCCVLVDMVPLVFPPGPGPLPQPNQIVSFFVVFSGFLGYTYELQMTSGCQAMLDLPQLG